MPPLPPPTGFTLRKGVVAKYVSFNQYGDWVHLNLTDPAMVGVPLADKDLAVTVQSTGERLPIVVVERDARHILLAVGLPGQSIAGVSLALWVYVSPGTAAPWTPTSWGATAVPDTDMNGVGPFIPIKDGRGNWWNGGASMRRWVHPQVMRVDDLTGDQAWLGYENEAQRSIGVRAVSHVRIDTPYPGGDQAWENPYLLYSKDNGATWAEFNATINPIVQRPLDPTHFSSDVGFAVRTDGTLYCTSRMDLAGPSQIWRTLVKGTSLENAAVVAGGEPAQVNGTIVGSPSAPSVVAAAPNEWYLYFFQNASTSRALFKALSTDQGESWGTPTLMIGTGPYQTELSWSNNEILRRPWHGGISAKAFGGWWYYYITETSDQTQQSNIALNGRLYRAAHPAGPWEPMRVPTIKLTPGTWAADGLYMGNVFERTDGSLALFCSGTTNGAGNMGVHVVPLDLSGSFPLASVAEAMSWGTGETLKYNIVNTPRRVFDFGEGPGAGLNDLSGNNGHATVAAGAPAQTPGVGYTFAGNAALTTNFDLQDAGGPDTPDQRWIIECEFTVTPAQGAAANQVMPLWGSSGAGPITGVRSEVVGTGVNDWLRTHTGWADAAATENNITQWNSTALPAGWDTNRHILRIAYTGSVFRYFLDGKEFFTLNKNTAGSPSLVRDVGNPVWIGGLPALVQGLQFGHGTVHRWSYRAMDPTARAYDEYAPYVLWTAGTEVLGGGGEPGPLVGGTLTAAAPGTTSVALTWGAPSGGTAPITSLLQRGLGASPSSWTTVATLGSASGSHTDTGRSPATQYTYRVQYTDSTSGTPQVAFSNALTVTTAVAGGGQSAQLTATVRRRSGAVANGKVVVWSSSDPSVAAVSSAGLVTALKPGVAHVVAQCEGVRAVTRVVVTPP